MKRIVLIIAIAISSGLNAQIGVSVGGNTQNTFGVKGTWGGVHLGIEVPTDDQTSFYGRVTHNFSRSAQDSLLVSLIGNDGFTYSTLTTVPRMNATILEGGNRYYTGNGFDFGWSAYGGSTIQLHVNRVKMGNAPYDDENFIIDPLYQYDGWILNFAVGLNGGVKYSIPRVGTVYADFTGSYILFSQPSQQVVFNAVSTARLWNRLNFAFNLGIRKDILW
ncbi:MAG: hypothetical protein MK066_06125 [Crocinitomicaceae bacterium]|nr:hypothetical protein [Crocinitomicaceae bacterium]